jgi:lipopolysaccharide/colanic/teichoic acid biosynthesis glycosyltransferase
LGILFLPPIIATAILIVCTSGTPVLFTQTRAGLHGKLFNIYKLRTMRIGNGSDEERLTTLGKFLRKCSLDELPQLFNVLCGDMSLVGPRPLLEQYLPLYSERQSRRHEVKPGITGWAQVHGRNAANWDDRLEKDVWYVEHRSLLLDLHIILKTVLKVVTGSGVSAEERATVEPFKGSHQE